MGEKDHDTQSAYIHDENYAQVFKTKRGCKVLFWQIAVEVLWWLEKRTSWLWNKMYPEDEVSYWFDFATAATYTWRKNAERYLYRSRTGKGL